ncbi:MAG TPA: hypothetical protein VHZ81_11065 [Galbitalea sp.]|nr:hypothetical protein [Galbitalea sp.]
MTDSQPRSAPAEKPLFTGRFVVPQGYPRAASRAFTQFQFSRPAVWIPLAVFVVVFGLAAWDAAARGTSFGGFTILLPILVAAFLAFNMISRSRALERQLTTNARPGSIYEVTLTESIITTRTPMASSSVRYDYYERLNVQGGFLFLKLRGARVRSIVPRGLYSDEALDFLRSRIR